jgi:hypothetical protein
VLPGAIFQRPVNPQVLYQVVRWQRAKRRAVHTSVPNIHTYQDLGYSWFPCAWRAVDEAGESARKHDAGGQEEMVLPGAIFRRSVNPKVLPYHVVSVQCAMWYAPTLKTRTRVMILAVIGSPLVRRKKSIQVPESGT